MKILAFAALLLVLGCASAPQQQTATTPHGDPHGDIRFWVYMVTPEKSALLHAWPSVPVYLVSPEGQRKLGKTDMNGQVTIQKDQIWVEGAQALLFCLEDSIQCSALRVETEWLRGFDEFTVEIPVPRIVD
jgi:hypothetical protein